MACITQLTLDMNDDFILVDEISKAASEFAVRHSVPLGILRTDQPYLGTGICIAIAERSFIATAAHNFLGVDSDDQIVIVPPGRRSTEGLSFLGRNSTSGDDSDELDVAWLEISSDVRREVGQDFVPLRQLLPGVNHVKGNYCVVQGCPAAFIDQESVRRGQIDVRAMALMTRTMDPLESNVQANPDIDIILNYPVEAEPFGTAPDRQVPNPYGISGGAIWVIRDAPPGEVWSMKYARLIGIEKKWNPRERYLRATQIQHWLGLIGADFPELKEVIEETLPPPSVPGAYGNIP